MNKYDVIIIGAGIAGMTSAIYLKRANVNVVIIEHSAPGGQLLKANRIENYPGFTSINGADLSLKILEQVNNLNIKIIYEDVIDIENNDIKMVKTNKNVYETSNIIIAAGRICKKLNLLNEEKFTGHGISWCATCDGTLYKDYDVAIVGSNEKTIEEAYYLSDLCNTVYLITSKELKKDITKKNIIIKKNSYITKLNGDDSLQQIEINNNELINIKGLFINIGSIPDTNFLKHLNLKIENNYIVVDNKMRTNIDGIYAVGDIIKKDLYQLVTASSEGAIAAINIKKNM